MTSDKPGSGTSHIDARKDHVRDRSRLKKFIKRVLRLARKHEKLDVLALTLTYPDWADPDWFFADAHALAKALAGVEHEGIWLMADTSTRHGFHWHGIALASRSRESLAQWWADATGASVRAVKITYVKGQDERDSAKFSIHLGRAIRYRAKPAPGLGLLMTDRAVASGPLKEAWIESFGCVMPDKYMAPATPGRAGPHAPPKVVGGKHDSNVVRICARPGCGQPIPEAKPLSTKYWPPSCRSKHWRERNAARRVERERSIPITLPKDRPEPDQDDT